MTTLKTPIPVELAPKTFPEQIVIPNGYSIQLHAYQSELYRVFSLQIFSLVVDMNVAGQLNS